MNVNLKLIQAFLAVAEFRNFRRAAEATNRTTSAVSMQVRQLEDQVGAALFQRTTRRVELTPEGRDLLECARRAMTDLDTGLRALKDAVLLRDGVVSVACSPTIAASLLPGVLADFGRDHPRVTVRLRELGSQDILAAVLQGEVDFGVGPTVAAAADFQFQPLLRDELCALVPIGHPLARRRSLGLHLLEGVPMVMLSNFAAIRRLVEDAAAAADVALTVQYEVQQMQTLVALATAGLGLAVSTRIAVRALGRLQGVSVVALGVPVLAREISVITARGRALAPVAAELAGRMHSAA